MSAPLPRPGGRASEVGLLRGEMAPEAPARCAVTDSVAETGEVAVGARTCSIPRASDEAAGLDGSRVDIDVVDLSWLQRGVCHGTAHGQRCACLVRVGCNDVVCVGGVCDAAATASAWVRRGVFRGSAAHTTRAARRAARTCPADRPPTGRAACRAPRLRGYPHRQNAGPFRGRPPFAGFPAISAFQVDSTSAQARYWRQDRNGLAYVMSRS
jgi:hypothetical protein